MSNNPFADVEAKAKPIDCADVHSPFKPPVASKAPADGEVESGEGGKDADVSRGIQNEEGSKESGTGG